MEQAIFLYATLRGFHHTSSVSGIPLQTLTDFGRKESCHNTTFSNAVVKTLKKSIETMGIYDAAEYFGLTSEIFQALIDSNVERAFLFHAKNAIMPYSVDKDTQTSKPGLKIDKWTGIKIAPKFKGLSNIVSMKKGPGGTEINLNQALDIPPIVVIDVDKMIGLENGVSTEPVRPQNEKLQKEFPFTLKSVQQGRYAIVPASEVRKKQMGFDADKPQFQPGNFSSRENLARDFIIADNIIPYKNNNLPAPNNYNSLSNVPSNFNPSANRPPNLSPPANLSPNLNPPVNLSQSFNPPANLTPNFTPPPGSSLQNINPPPNMNALLNSSSNSNASYQRSENIPINTMTQNQYQNINSIRIGNNLPQNIPPQAVNPNIRPQNMRIPVPNNISQPQSPSLNPQRSGDLEISNMIPQASIEPRSTSSNEVPATMKRIMNPGSLQEHKPVKGTITNPDYSYIP